MFVQLTGFQPSHIFNWKGHAFIFLTRWTLFYFTKKQRRRSAKKLLITSSKSAKTLFLAAEFNPPHFELHAVCDARCCLVSVHTTTHCNDGKLMGFYHFWLSKKCLYCLFSSSISDISTTPWGRWWSLEIGRIARHSTARKNVSFI